MRPRSVRGARGALLAFALTLAVGLPMPAVAAPSSTPTPAPAASGGDYRVGVVLVGFELGASAAQRDAARAAVGATRHRTISPLAPDAEVLRLPEGMAVGAAIAALRGRPGVRDAEADLLYRLDATSNDPCYVASGGCGGYDLWGMYGDTTTPANAYGSQAGEAWAAGATGSSAIYVGVIDSGLAYGHPDLAANVGNPNEIAGNGVDDDGNGFTDDRYGYDFWNGDADPYDDNGHGTHVAGTIGAVGGNGVGVAGVNWSVRMISGKVGSAGGSVSVSAGAAAVDYFTDLKLNRGLNVVATNNSWGGTGVSQTLIDAIIRGGNAGILFVAAAGNNGTNNDTLPFYPASYSCATATRAWDCVVSVAAIDRSGALAGFSNTGATSVDLGAPGVGIVSTYPGGYAVASGTSMASPHVTGAIALCASITPALGGTQLRQAVLDAGAPTASLSGITLTGDRLDVGAMQSLCGRRTIAVTKSGTGSGTVTSSPSGISCGATCSANFLYGTTVTLTATAASGSVFTGWSGDGGGTTTTCTLPANSARSVGASFAPAATLTVSKTSLGAGAGTITSTPSGISCGSVCSARFAVGTTVTLAAVASTGSVFVGWSANCTLGTAATICQTTMDAAKTVTATFQGVRTLTAAKTGLGTVTSNVGGIDCGSTCSTTVNYGTSITLTAAPATGYRFASWTNCPSVSANTCTVSLTTNRTITANFAQITYTLSVTRSSVGSGTGTVTSSPTGISCGSTCSRAFATGTVVTLTATPSSGSVFRGWSANCTPVTATTCEVTMDAARSRTWRRRCSGRRSGRSRGCTGRASRSR
ncbi:MAG: S8 family serine peptidase [Actinomycetota bacterium]